MKRILIVSSDSDTTKSVFSAFQNRDYEIVSAESGHWALEILETIDIDLIISDSRIPIVGGYELLKKVKDLHPDVIRIIMGSADEETSILTSILHNIARFYILTPWNNENLLQYIEQIFDTEDILKSKDLLQLVNSIEKLPTIEKSYQKILGMIEKDADTAAISAEIEKDYSISSQLLQIANSAYYGLQTGSIKHATVYLGMQNLKSLIYSTSILNSFHSVSEQDQKRISDLWSHALITSKLLHYIYEAFLGKKLPEEACSAGLLHNIGNLILIYSNIEKYTAVINRAHPKLHNLLTLERDIFRVTHQEAGGYLVSWWKLPFPIIEAALYHHNPLDPKVCNREIVAAVHLAQHYAWILTKQPVVTEFHEKAFDILRIPKDKFEAAVNWKSWS